MINVGKNDNNNTLNRIFAFTFEVLLIIKVEPSVRLKNAPMVRSTMIIGWIELGFILTIGNLQVYDNVIYQWWRLIWIIVKQLGWHVNTSNQNLNPKLVKKLEYS